MTPLLQCRLRNLEFARFAQFATVSGRVAQRAQWLIRPMCSTLGDFCCSERPNRRFSIQPVQVWPRQCAGKLTRRVFSCAGGPYCGYTGSVRASFKPLCDALERQGITDVELVWQYRRNPYAPIRIEWCGVYAESNGAEVLFAISHCRGFAIRIFWALEGFQIPVHWSH